MKFVDLYAQYLTLKEEIDAAITDVIQTSSFVLGPHVEAFEQDFAKATEAAYCVSCADGTSALYIALRALGVKTGDEVIVPAHTWISTSETVSQAGGRVVFADTDSYFGVDPADVERKITSRTRGIIGVHLYGLPCDAEALARLAKKHGLFFVEDCAQAHLARLYGKPVGSFGDVATYSFYPSKNLGAMGDGGALTTNSEAIADFARLFARHGGKGKHVMEGVNSRLDGLQAAILSVKLRHLSTWTKQRRVLAQRYTDSLQDIANLETPRLRRGAEHVYHLYVIRAHRRDALRDYLRERDIPTILNYPRALPFLPAYTDWGHTEADFPLAAKAQGEIVSLPLFPEMTHANQDLVVKEIRSFYGGN